MQTFACDPDLSDLSRLILTAFAMLVKDDSESAANNRHFETFADFVCCSIFAGLLAITVA
ncbi:hypothetical protein EOM81_07280 [bacterium]|nr:hypothetical protein [bacterium]